VNFDRYTISSHEMSQATEHHPAWRPVCEIVTRRGAYVGKAPKTNDTNSNAAHLLPRMADAGGGTFLLTSGMPTPVPGVLSLSLGKAGVRALAEALHAQFRPAGVHVTAVTIAGAVAPGSAFDPDEIAEHYWRLHTQAADAWEHELVYHGRAAAAPLG